MKTPSDSPYKLEVARAELAQALKIVARAIRKRPGDARLRFGNGCLSIEAYNTKADTPARGRWPLPIFVGTSWVSRLAKRLPDGDTIHLRIDSGKLYANRFSEPCDWTPRQQPVPTEPPPIDEGLLIQEAARILKPLRVGRSDFEELASEARARGTASWSLEEKKMIAIVAKAWVLLAPLGVEPADIRRLVDKAVRNAWK
jgi:hypothetical protein